MSEDERQPCLNENKDQTGILDSELCETNVKENDCSEAQPLNEHEVLDDKNNNELENEVLCTESEHLNESDDSKHSDYNSDVDVGSEAETVKEVQIKTRNNSESNNNGDLAESNEECESKETDLQNNVEETFEEKEVGNLLLFNTRISEP